MALLAYTAGESLEEIVNDCERIVSNPGLNLDPTTKLPPIDGALHNAPAYRWLLDIIRNLYLDTDWHFAIQARTLVFTSERCLLLPEDFWRMAYDNPLYGNAPGRRFGIRQITRQQFFNNMSDLSSNRKGLPTTFYVSRPDGLIYLNPIPNEVFTYELHYFRLIEELTSIIEIPQFPYRDYLRQALLIRYFEDQDDSRLGEAEQLRQQMWMQLRSGNYDVREDAFSTPAQGLLDSQYFPSVTYDD